MRVWLVKVGEPLPIDRMVRPFRYGVLAQMLASEGHEVTWWTSTFDHVTKKQRYAQNQTVDVERGYRINRLRRWCGWSWNMCTVCWAKPRSES